MLRALAFGLTLAMTALPALAQTPLVIAHRGASAFRPEHTRAAYELAIEQGADFIEPDLVMTKDGVLVVRHENEIGETTDVADHAEFADRRTTKTIDGRPVEGWFTEDFTVAELKTLRARERLPRLRPASAAFDGQEPILTFQEVIDIARAASARTGRTIGVAPELKHPTYFASAGLEMLTPFVAALRANGLDGAEAPILIQCFEVEPLRRLDAMVEAPLVQLVSPAGGPADASGLAYAAMIAPEGLAEVATYADVVAAETSMILPRLLHAAPSTLVRDAHAAGLKVVAWTFRPENAFLGPLDRSGSGVDPATAGERGDIDAMLRAFYALGVDGVFSDDPAAAVAARGVRPD
jgi:glycerophosphoryl diester phosphodiesterase